jgi:elongation factor Ts
MAEITATLVKQLRERTGAGMMECKSALNEAKGDLSEAEVVLRKRGIASAGKKATRTTKQGTVGTYIHAKPAAIAAKIVEGRMSKFYEEVCLYDQPFVKDNAVTIDQLVKTKIAKLGENISVSRFARFKVGDAIADQPEAAA